MLLAYPISRSCSPTTHVLFVATEAACKFALRAIKQGKKAPVYAYMSDLCPWDLDCLPYVGLCSHNPLHEAVPGDHGFSSAEELLAQTAIIMERRARYLVQWRANQKVNNPVHYRERRREGRRLYIERHPERDHENQRRPIRKAVEQKSHYRNICEHAYTKPCYLRKHLKSRKHARKAASLDVDP